MDAISFKTHTNDAGNIEVEAGLIFNGVAIIDQHYADDPLALEKTKEQLKHALYRELFNYLAEHFASELNHSCMHRFTTEMVGRH